jgi:DNA invertase Pin-like site-specific DNA recombinase
MTSRNRQAKGSKVGTSKLTEELVKMIRSMSGSSSTLSTFFGVSKTTIKDIKNNKIWKHV